MRAHVRQALDLFGALRVLRFSPLFRRVTRFVLWRVCASAFILVIATVVGLFAIDSQAHLLKLLGHIEDGWSHLASVCLTFFFAQIFYEWLQWRRRALQNRLSVLITDFIRTQIFQRFSEFTYIDLQLQSAGDVAQLHASDASQIAAIWSEGILPFLMTLILTIGVSIFLSIQVGPPGSVFFVVLIVLIFLAQRFARNMAPALQKRAQFSAQRLSVLQESIRSVFMVKALNAESEFTHRVRTFANLEQDMKLLSNQMSCRYVPVFASLRWFAWAAVLIWAVYAPFVTAKNFEPHALAALVFAVNWYSSLLQDSFLFVGTYLSFIQVGAVSVQRLDAFLNQPRHQPLFSSPEQCRDPAVLIGVEDMFIEYPSRPGCWALENVTVSAREGQLIALIGPVGSGKSTLLRTLLGELSPARGHVVRRLGVKVGYLSQDVVLPSASLRDVLRFEFENSKNEDVGLMDLLNQAEFRTDVLAMPEGLGTQIGERGVTLSGGQRLRVGLAQLSYFKDADVLLLDDPVAALDSATADALISGLICGVWAKKTRIISTHQMELAQKADWVVRFENGRVVEQGPPRSVQLPKSSPAK